MGRRRNERTRGPRFWEDPLRVHTLRYGRTTALVLEVPEEVWVKEKTGLSIHRLAKYVLENVGILVSHTSKPRWSHK